MAKSGKENLFPNRIVREIITVDPDVHAIDKNSVDLVRRAAEYFAESLVNKCFAESKRKGKVTANISDFVAAVQDDETLAPMFAQFIGSDRMFFHEEQMEEEMEENEPVNN